MERAIEPISWPPRDAAQALGISERLLWDWTRTEGVPHVRIGNMVLYPVEALKSWLADRAAVAVEASPMLPDNGSHGHATDWVERLFKKKDATHGSPDATQSPQ